MSARRSNHRKINEQITSEPSTSHELHDTSQISGTGSFSAKMDLDREPPLTGPVTRPCLRKLNRPYKSKKTTVQSRLESRRVDAMAKHAEAARIMAESAPIMAESALIMAESALIMAESSRTQAEAAKLQADTMRSLVDLINSNALLQQKSIHVLRDLIRKKANKK